MPEMVRKRANVASKHFGFDAEPATQVFIVFNCML